MECIVCGKWFASSNKNDEICGKCERSPTIINLLDKVDRLTAELEQYKRIEREGRLVVLPCRIGSQVWALTFFGNKPVCYDVREITLFPDGNYRLRTDGERVCERDNLGIKWFFTHEEAEAALARQQEGGESK